MAEAYTPGLKVKKLTTVHKRRRLPLPGDVLVKEGDIVTADTVVAKTSVPGDPHLVNVAYSLGVEADKIVDYLLKKVGDDVEKGEIIARYSAFFGLLKRELESPVRGKIEHISSTSGQVTIREPPIPVEVDAHIPGRIVEVSPDGAVVETTASFIQGIFGVGGERRGELKMIANSPDEVLTEEEIGPDCSGKILVGGSLATKAALHKATKVGVKGIVVGGIEDEDLIDFLGYDIGVAITGHEDIDISLIVTEGFGEMRMSDRTFNLLKKYDGKQSCINGATQIRAGVIRPEVIIPQEGKDYPISEKEERGSMGLEVGTPIRIIREPHFGGLGHVVRLPVELQEIETESKVRVLEVELEGGKRIVLPRANVEIIEE